MSKSATLTVTLPVEMADLVRAKVASGKFATEIDVVEEGLRALVAKDQEIQRWLRDDVAPEYDAYKADPSAARTLDEACKELEAFMDATEDRSR